MLQDIITPILPNSNTPLLATPYRAPAEAGNEIAAQNEKEEDHRNGDKEGAGGIEAPLRAHVCLEHLQTQRQGENIDVLEHEAQPRLTRSRRS